MPDSITINFNGAVIPLKFRPMVGDAKRHLTQFVEVGFPNKYKIPVKFFRVSAHGLVVPPTYITRQRELIYTDTRTEPDAFQHEFVGTLYDTQKVVTKKAAIELAGAGCATLVMPTGSGKTVCALFLARHLGIKPIILVHKTFLVEQWKARIHQCFGPDIKVSIVKGRHVDTSGDIVVGLIQTFIAKKAPLPTSCGTLIIDEAHHIAAKQFREIVMTLMTNQRYVLGLSATPVRKDGIDIRPLIGDYIKYEDTLPAHIPGSTANVVVNMHIYSDETYLGKNQPLTKHGDVSYSNMITAVSQNVTRTEFICNLIQKQVGRDILVLSHRRKHCTEIYERLKSTGLDVALFLPNVGGTKPTHEPPANRIIVSTYNYVSEGFDVPRLDCVVFATPASNLKQSVGRVLRRQGHAPVVVDICDAWGVLDAQTSKRRAYYQDQKYMIYTLYNTNRPRKRSVDDDAAVKGLFLADD